VLGKPSARSDVRRCTPPASLKGLGRSVDHRGASTTRLTNWNGGKGEIRMRRCCLREQHRRRYKRSDRSFAAIL